MLNSKADYMTIQRKKNMHALQLMNDHATTKM